MRTGSECSALFINKIGNLQGQHSLVANICLLFRQRAHSLVCLFLFTSRSSYAKLVDHMVVKGYAQYDSPAAHSS